jgi:hypothetical protein
MSQTFLPIKIGRWVIFEESMTVPQSQFLDMFLFEKEIIEIILKYSA